jgi:hypothetical protein
MRRRAETAGLLAVLSLAAAAPEPAPLIVRTGDHPGFGRVVFDLPDAVGVQSSSEHGDIVLRFTAPVQLELVRRLARNVRRISADGPYTVTLELDAGATARVMQYPQHRLVIDAGDPSAEPAHPPAPVPVPSHRAAAVEGILPTLARLPPHAPAPLSAPAPKPTPTPTPAYAVTPPRPTPSVRAPLAAPQAAATPAPGGSAQAAPAQAGPAPVLLRFPIGVGAALLNRGGQDLLVFDRAAPVALPAEGPLAHARVTMLPDAVVVAVVPPAGTHLALSRERWGWRVDMAAVPTLPPAAIDRPAGTVLVHTLHPARTVTIPDPESGGPLLVGTEAAATDRIDSGWQTPDFALLPTRLGVAVEPFSDRVQLATVAQGFRLGADLGVLPLSAGPIAGSAVQRIDALSQALELPDMPRAALSIRSLREQQAAADAPPLARTEPRLGLARTLLALGMEDDALGVLGVAGSTNPALLQDPGYNFLSGAAQVLAGRPEQATGLAAPNLPATDDVALWRALRDAETETAPPGTGAVLARTAPILLSYPDAVRRMLLPLATETMIADGETAAAQVLLAARPHDPTLALARAMQAEKTGQVQAALAQYDALADGRDRLVRIRAAMRAVDLRVARNLLTPGAAADALARLEDAWRGDRFDLARREQEAAFRAKGGEPAEALETLRSAIKAFPAAAPDVRKRMQAMLTAVLLGPKADATAPAALISMLNANPDLFGDFLEQATPDERRHVAETLLADQLPGAADPVLSRLIEGAPPDSTRAALGARLAELRMAAGADNRARQALEESAADSLPPDLAAHRAVLAARLQAKAGDLSGAAAALGSISSPEAEQARADIAEQTGDYAAAATALLSEANRRLPPQAPLAADGQALILRLATDASRGGNVAALSAIRENWVARLPAGEATDTVRLLLSPPIRQLADLPRAAQDAKLAAEMAQGLIKGRK